MSASSFRTNHARPAVFLMILSGCSGQETPIAPADAPGLDIVRAQQALPPTITFKGLKDGCKLFDITVKDNLGRPTTLSKVEVQGTEIGKVSSTGPHAVTKTPSPGLTDLFTIQYVPAQEAVTVTVCPVAKFKSSYYFVRAFHTATRVVSSELSVSEQTSQSYFGTTFVGLFEIPKPFEKVDIEQLKKSVVTDNIKDIKVFKRVTRADFTVVNVNGTLIDNTKPGTAVLIADPPTEVILLVLEVCAVSQRATGSPRPGSVIDFAICPENVPLAIPLPPLPPPLPEGELRRFILACRAMEVAIAQFADPDVAVRDQATATALALLIAERKSTFFEVLSQLGSVTDREFNDPDSKFNRLRRALEATSCIVGALKQALSSGDAEVRARARDVLARGIFNPFGN